MKNKKNDDLSNYKGIYANDKQDNKYQDPKTGAHFNYADMCIKLAKLQQEQPREDPILQLECKHLSGGRNNAAKKFQSIGNYNKICANEKIERNI